MIEWLIQKRKLTDLKPWNKNPRKISKHACAKLVERIKVRGFHDVLKIDENNVVLSGNQRLRALKECGFTEVDVKVPSSKITEEQKSKVGLESNLSDGEWDNDLLTEWFDKDFLEDIDFPMDDLDFDVDDMEPEEVPVPDEKDVESKVEVGDIWQLGKHRLFCGDCADKSNIEKLMDGEKSSLLHADPPYGMGKEKDGVVNDNLYSKKLDDFQMKWWLLWRDYLESNASVYIWGNSEDLWRLWYTGGLKDSERLTFRNEIVWDKQGEENPTLRVCGATFKKDRSYTRSERCLFFMRGEQGFNNNSDNYWKGFESLRSYFEKEIKKLNMNDQEIASALGFRHARSVNHWYSKSQWEFINEENYAKLQEFVQKKAFKKEYSAFKKEYSALKKEFYATRAYFDNTHDSMTDVWQFERVQGDERCNHPTPKAVEIICRIIKSSSPSKAIIIDPFLGSGTTLLAAEQSERICYGMEILPEYCDIIIARWEKFTGKKAKKIT